MRGTPDVGGIYPLSTSPAEGYNSDPADRTGKVVITHVNGLHVMLDDNSDGYSLVAKLDEASQFDSHAEASLVAAELIAKATARKAA